MDDRHSKIRRSDNDREPRIFLKSIEKLRSLILFFESGFSVNTPVSTTLEVIIDLLDILLSTLIENHIGDFLPLDSTRMEPAPLDMDLLHIPVQKDRTHPFFNRLRKIKWGPDTTEVRLLQDRKDPLVYEVDELMNRKSVRLTKKDWIEPSDDLEDFVGVVLEALILVKNTKKVPWEFLSRKLFPDTENTSSITSTKRSLTPENVFFLKRRRARAKKKSIAAPKR